MQFNVGRWEEYTIRKKSWAWIQFQTRILPTVRRFGQFLVTPSPFIRISNDRHVVHWTRSAFENDSNLGCRTMVVAIFRRSTRQVDARLFPSINSRSRNAKYTFGCTSLPLWLNATFAFLGRAALRFATVPFERKETEFRDWGSNWDTKESWGAW